MCDKKEGFLIKNKRGNWGEAAPIPERSSETLEQVFSQLKMVQEGNLPTHLLYPSVWFALQGLKWDLDSLVNRRVPMALFFQGSGSEIRKKALQYQSQKKGLYAKLKVGDLEVGEAIELAEELNDFFRLRIDVEGKWDRAQMNRFCSKFKPSDFQFIEDPAHNVSPFPAASDALSLTGQPEYVVWKPMIRGAPQQKRPIILSSSYETGVGTAHMIGVNFYYQIPEHHLGIGTYLWLKEDFLEMPLVFDQGALLLPPKLKIRENKISLC